MPSIFAIYFVSPCYRALGCYDTGTGIRGGAMAGAVGGGIR